jgi:hypothetical protein
VYAIAAFDDGAGSKLYVGGLNSLQTPHVSRWNGSSWSAVGTLFGDPFFDDAALSALTSFDDGTGSALYAGGQISVDVSSSPTSVARWNGTSWSDVGNNLQGIVGSMLVFDDGGGAALYALGNLSTPTQCSVAKWNGSSWTAIGMYIGPYANTIASFDAGSGAELYVGGAIDHANGDALGGSAHAVRWNGTRWIPVGALSTSTHPNRVLSLQVFDDGSGPALCSGGSVLDAQTGVANGVVSKLTGTDWSPIGGGLNAPVSSLAIFDFGAGQDLYAGGGFTKAGRFNARHVARLTACP